jgi:DNA helicase-2/ATP-dependent DNA helicase PcrA
LNELPLDLLEDLSRGKSWLKSALQGNIRRISDYSYGGSESFGVKKAGNYSGKSYNSVESVKDFFKHRKTEPQSEESSSKGGASQSSQAGGFKPGMRVKHPKYGFGLVLKREGEGDGAKLLVSFPGFGQKKLVEKFANLEKA